MSILRTSTRAFAASGLLCFGTAALVAGCGGGGSSSPTPSGSPVVVSGVTCAGATGGVAYIPDGSRAPGSGSGSGGSLTIIPFETTSGTFTSICPQTKLTLPQSISDLAISSQGIAIALQSNNTFIGINQLVNGGSPNSFQNSQPFPSPSGMPFTATSLAVVPNGTTGLAVGTPFQGFVGVNNLFGLAPAALPTPLPSSTPIPTAPPMTVGTTPTPTVTQTPVPFAGLVAYSDVASNSSKSTGLNPAMGTRTSLALAPNAATLLVRGSDLATFSLVSTLAGYYFTFPAAGSATDITTVPAAGISTALGVPSGTLPIGNIGRGLIAFYPGDSSQAVIGQTTSSANVITHVSNLPNSIQVGATFTVQNTVTSVAVTPSGNYAIIGTSAGIFVANLANGGGAATAAGVSTGAVNSVGVSPDGNFVLAQSGNTLTVYAFSNGNLSGITGGTFTLPATTQGDYMVVR